jgi:hypothetical protein
MAEFVIGVLFALPFFVIFGGPILLDILDKRDARRPK